MLNVEWRRLSDQILGLSDAAKYALETANAVGSDYHGVTNELIRHGQRIAEQLERFADRHVDSLPAPASTRLQEFVKSSRGNFERAAGWAGIQLVVTLLLSFRAEFESLLADTEAIARSMVTRAFVHLNRSLVVNPEMKRLWQEAFHAGEPTCEKLGAVHLLSFGVWAFKVSGAGERTDLVLQEPLNDIAAVQRAADALVLTEWKVVRDGRQLAAAIAEASDQARRYAVGVLAPLELSSRRYLVLVSADVLPLPGPREHHGVVYEPVNVAIDPAAPSRARRR